MRSGPADQREVLTRSPALLVLGPLVAIALVTAPLVRQVADVRWAGPDRMRIYVAVPADVEIDYGLADAALHETDLALAWLESQVGRQLRGADIRFAEVVQLQATSQQLVGEAGAAFSTIRQEIAAHAADDRIFPVILAEVRTETATTGWLTCGLGGTGGLVMFLRNCPGHQLSRSSTWGSAASATIAHELVHGLGAVQDCAPHATTDGHVTDDPADILYDARRQRDDSRPMTLDAGRDDYLDHDVAGCPDIADSPLWDD